MLDRTERRSARTAAVTADQHDIGVRFCNTRGYGPNADFRHQLHRNPRARIRILQVVNQLREIFDGINIVMRRRRNQAHARSRMTQSCDHFIHFVAGKLPTFAGLCALRHFDLQLIGIDQII